jgi:glycine/D-amino acid oxidase-like deaminating enzyme
MGVTTCDVLVIGAGIAGCIVACELPAPARVGLWNVARCARLKRSMVEDTPVPPETSVRAGMETVCRLATFEEEFGIDPVFRQAGCLVPPRRWRQRRTLERAVRVQNACGVATRLVGPDEVARLVPGINLSDVAGAAHNPTDGYVDPNSMVAGFASGARARGAVILQESPVIAIETRGGKVTGVTTASGAIAPDVVLNAAGAWAPAIAAMYGGSLPITARRNDIFVLDRTPAPGKFLPLTIDLVTGLYLHSEGDGLVAGPAESFTVPDPPANVAVDWEVLPFVVERLVHRLPMLGAQAGMHGWAGFSKPHRTTTRVGWTHLDNLYTMAGFSGHGMCLSPGPRRIGERLRDRRELRSTSTTRAFRRGRRRARRRGGSGIAAGMAKEGNRRSRVPDDLGPCVDDEILPGAAGAAHYGDSWTALYKHAVAGMRDVFKTEGEVHLVFGSGMAGVEMCIASVLSPGDEVLIPTNGLFGDRMAEVSTANGLKVHSFSAGVGQAITAAHVRDELAAHPGVRACASSITRPRSGLNEVEESAARADHGALAIVDGISAVGSVPFDMDAWGPTSASPWPTSASAGRSAWPLSRPARALRPSMTAAEGGGWYLNLATWRKYSELWSGWHPHPTTMPTNVIRHLTLRSPGCWRRGGEPAAAGWRSARPRARRAAGNRFRDAVQPVPRPHR